MKRVQLIRPELQKVIEQDIPDFDPPLNVLIRDHVVYIRQEDGTYKSAEHWDIESGVKPVTTVHMHIDDYTRLCNRYKAIRHPQWGSGTMDWRFVTCPGCKKLKGSKHDPWR